MEREGPIMPVFMVTVKCENELLKKEKNVKLKKEKNTLSDDTQKS